MQVAQPPLAALGQQGALVVFGVGGTFVTFQYTEMLWHTLALSMVVNHLVTERANATARAATPLGHPAMTRLGPRIVPGTPRPLSA